jgi:asparaginyl-tRNA synthetase
MIIRWALKEHGVDFALDNRHLWIRMSEPMGHPAGACHDYSARSTNGSAENGFIHMDTPILTPAACEGHHDTF